jgi:PAS domain S-box-containing protein
MTMRRGLDTIFTITSTDADQLRRGRNAVVLAIGMIVLCLLSIPLALSTPRPLHGLLALVTGLLAYLGVLVLVRRGAVDLGALLIAIFPAIIVLAGIVAAGEIQVRPFYLVLSVLLAAILLPPRQILLMGLGCFVGLLGVVALLPGEPLDAPLAPQALFGALILLALTTVVGVLGATTILATFREREQVTAALRESEERFQLAAMAVRAAIYEWDLASDTVSLSAGLEQALGYEPSTTEVSAASWRARVHEDDVGPMMAAIGEALRHDKGFSLQHRLRDIDGGYRYVLNRGLIVRSPDGRPLRVIGSAEDVSEQRQAEAIAAQAQKLESVGQLAGGMAHDFNNVLTLISGNVSLAIESLAPGDPMRDDLQVAADAAERAAALIRQLLTFGRGQAMASRIIDLNDLLIVLERLLRPMLQSNIRFELQPQPGLWPISADPGQLEQVLVNLVLNARDAMPLGGTLTVATENVELGPEPSRPHQNGAARPQVLLLVSDTGVGMSPEILAHVFEPFFTTKAPGAGTGLGLATCYGIVKQHGGTIWCESEPGRGTTFHILLPRASSGQLDPVGPGANLRANERGDPDLR